MDIKQVIGELDIFQGLSQRQTERLAQITSTRKVNKGEIIFLAGEEAKGFYGVASGMVRIFRSSPSGKEQILHVFGPGFVFAEVAVLKGRVFPADAQALEDSELLFFPREAFRRMLAEDPDMAMEMLALLAMRLRTFVHKIEELSLKEVPARLAAYLLLLRASQDSDQLRLDLPKGQIAAYLGTIQETLSRTLKRLAKEGIIDVQGKTVTILDKKSLELVAEQGR